MDKPMKRHSYQSETTQGQRLSEQSRPNDPREVALDLPSAHGKLDGNLEYSPRNRTLMPATYRRSVQANPLRRLLTVLALICAHQGAYAACAGSSPTWTSTNDIASLNSCISSASPGDTINVTGTGTVTWNSSFANTKGLKIRGPGAGLLTVTLANTITNTINNHASYSAELTGFAFSMNGNNGRMFVVGGNSGNKPVLIHDNVFNISTANAIRWEVNGGIFYKNTVNAVWDESCIQLKAGGDSQSWVTTDTLGMHDKNGTANTYIEDNIFNNGTNQCIDADDATRVVFRHNTLNFSSFNSHGKDTSPIGVRHFEVYSNDFNYTGSSVNQNWQIWIRGGSGVIYSNKIDVINFGNKSEVQLSLRAIDDSLCCQAHEGYPCLHQIGQGHDGKSLILDPLYVWGNTGTWDGNVTYNRWTQSCSPTVAIQNFVQLNRDYFVSSAAKPGYAAYIYPHPLRGSAPPPTSPPMNLRLQ
jgi:hypothetical protein